jgi:hypothetical protein
MFMKNIEFVHETSIRPKMAPCEGGKPGSHNITIAARAGQTRPDAGTAARTRPDCRMRIGPRLTFPQIEPAGAAKADPLRARTRAPPLVHPPAKNRLGS